MGLGIGPMLVGLLIDPRREYGLKIGHDQVSFTVIHPYDDSFGKLSQ